MTEQEGGNNQRVWMLVIGLVVLLFGVIYLMSPDDKYNWYHHAYAEDGRWEEEPYSTKYYFDYLKTLREEEAFFEVDSTIDRNLLPYIDSSHTDLNYVIVGFNPWLDSASVENAFRFVEQGNNFFLFSEVPPHVLMEQLNGGECEFYWPEYYEEYDAPYVEDTVVRTNFEHPNLRREKDFEFAHQIRGHQEEYNWYIVKERFFCEENTSLTPLGKIGEDITFFRVAYGDGFFYFHTNPKMFTNYYLVEHDGLDYAQRAMAHLEEGAIIYDRKKWQRDYKNSRHTDRFGQQEGPLKYILSQESLRWGFYVLLAASGFLMLFAFQRKQRMIPVIPRKENSSMEYVETITELYYQQGGQGRIFGHLTDQFLQFIRERYRLPTGDLRDGFDEKLALVSGAPLPHIKEILVTLHKGAHPPNVTSEMLVEYYKTLDRFYKECK